MKCLVLEKICKIYDPGNEQFLSPGWRPKGPKS